MLQQLCLKLPGPQQRRNLTGLADKWKMPFFATNAHMHLEDSEAVRHYVSLCTYLIR